nr:pentatricopeptide repeat-containing protein At1g12620-like isoform X1 [Populus alba]
MEEDGCMPNYCSYNVIIRGFLLHKDTSKARKLNEMVNRGFSADSDTKTLLGDLFPVDGSPALKQLLVPSEGCQADTGYQGAFEVYGVFPRILKHSKFLL